MIEGLLLGLTAVLLLSNALTAWILIKKTKKKPEVSQIEKAISMLQARRGLVLSVTIMDPDSVYLRSPGR
jgi:hypothetical protein